MIPLVPIGQYMAGNSYLHRRDPRAKFIGTVVFLFLVFLANSPLAFGIVSGAMILGILVSSIPLSYIIRTLKPVLWLVILTAIIQMFTLKKGELLATIGPFSIYEGGVQEAVYITLRITILMLSASLLTLTTSPIRLTDGLENLFSPLKRFRFPAHEMALMISITLRFIPTLWEEADRIKKAQMSRGASFSSGPLQKRLNHILSLIVPLFVQSFKRAEEMALAMEARGYRGGEGRTRYRRLEWNRGDTLFLIMILLIGGMIIATRYM
jgi:energy-coupling factor transport system permease protein